jgi:hypothetical protein
VTPEESLYAGWDPPRPGWVCPECGLDFDATDPATVAARCDGLVPEYRVRLAANPTRLRTRPDPATWSALEYACHVRDCFALYEWRIAKVLAEETPEFPQMRRDAVVVERAYNEQDPAAVAEEIAAGAAGLARVLGGAGGAAWQRIGVREGRRLSVGWMAVNTLHEARHHLVDVDRVLDPVGEPPYDVG